MVLYTLEINNVARNFTSIKFDDENKQSPDRWNATLEDIDESISDQDTVDIKRDGTIIFSGIVETETPKWDSSGSSKGVSGRHIKVKLWRKYCERYTDKHGFWTSYYPKKIIEFLLRPSFSDYDYDNYYTRVGWGMDPTEWTVTSEKAGGGSNDLDAGHGAVKLINRLDTVGFRSDSDQTNGDFIKVDLGDLYDIVAIRLENKPLKEGYVQEFIRNYTVDVSINDSTWVTKATQTDNRAINIVESWTPGTSYRYVRIRCTAGFADKWSASNLYVYESDNPITGISIGTISDHLPLNCSALQSDASGSTVTVEDGWRFQGRSTPTATDGDHIIVADDDGEEYAQVQTISGDVLTLTGALSGSYTTAKNGLVINYDREVIVNFDSYLRRTEAINRVVKLCTNTSDVPWIWEVENDGTFNAGERTGTDKSGSVSFVQGTNIETGSAEINSTVKIDRVLVLGQGKGDSQDRSRSGWVGSGEYEHVHVESSLDSAQATKGKAQEILQLNNSARTTEILTVDDDPDRDGHVTNAWGVDDDITITSAKLGLSGSYRVKKITRLYNASGELTTIHTTNVKRGQTETISKLLKDLTRTRQEQDESIGLDETVLDDARYVLKYEAEGLVLDSDVTKVPDRTASNFRYIVMTSGKSGDIITGGPGAVLEPGFYRVIFKSKVYDKSSGNDLLVLRVYSEAYGGDIETLTVKPSDYSLNDIWHSIAFTFEVVNPLEDIEFKVDTFATGITDWSCDFIGLTGNWIVDYPAGPPAAPTGFSAISTLAGVKLTWTKNTENDLDHYIIYRDDAPTSPTTEYARVYVNNFFDSDIDYVTVLNYRVKAVDWTGNESGYSSVQQAIPLQVGASDITPGIIDSDLLQIELRPWTSNISFKWDDKDDDPPTDFDHILWGEPGSEGSGDAAITWADGSTTDINFGASNGTAPPTGCGSNGLIYAYLDENYKTDGDYDVRFSVTYSDAVGVGRFLIAIMQLDNTPHSPTIAHMSSYTPTAGFGAIGAYSIFSKHISAYSILSDHITVSEWIEAKKFRSGSGANRIEWDTTSIKGYGGDVLQFEIKSADGSAYAGGGKVVLNDYGLTINQEAIRFKDTNNYGYIGADHGNTRLKIRGPYGLLIDFDNVGYKIQIAGDVEMFGIHTWYPSSHGTGYIGTSDNRFREMHASEGHFYTHLKIPYLSGDAVNPENGEIWVNTTL